MGVKTLWPLVSVAAEPADLKEPWFCGRVLAVDLAGWTVQSNQCKGVQGAVQRPHLRNLFFRTAALISLDVIPVFVLDGKAPDLKKATMEQRTGTQVKSLGRARLMSVMKECADLLSAMGAVFLRADGEAEAAAAKLDALGLVDAVVTDDSDALCYGARTVLRNFALSGSGALVDVVRMSKLEDSLKLDRNRLIMMAGLLGCDYCPAGVPGLGKETLSQLMLLWPMAWNPIHIFEMWHRLGFPEAAPSSKGSSKLPFSCQLCSSSRGHCEDCSRWRSSVFQGFEDCHCEVLSSYPALLKLENLTKKRCKAMGDETFWSESLPSLVAEFKKGDSQALLQDEEELKRSSKEVFATSCPDIAAFIAIAVDKLGWTEEYALEKILPVLTKYQLNCRIRSPSPSSSFLLNPAQVLKKRIVNGMTSFQVEWQLAGEDSLGKGQVRSARLIMAILENSSNQELKLETVEGAELVTNAYPKLVEDFEEALATKKKALKKPSRPRKTREKQLDETKKQQPAITQYFGNKKSSLSSQPAKKAILKSVSGPDHVEVEEFSSVPILDPEEDMVVAESSMFTSDCSFMDLEKSTEGCLKDEGPEEPDSRTSTPTVGTAHSPNIISTAQRKRTDKIREELLRKVFLDGSSSSPLTLTKPKQLKNLPEISAEASYEAASNSSFMDEPSSSVFNGVEDMSCLIEDIVGKPLVGRSSSHEEYADTQPPQQTSTPICANKISKCRNFLSTPAEATASPSLEDTFDRMCL